MRKRALLLALVGLCLPLLASEQVPFRVGIIALEEEGSSYLTLISEAGKTYASTFLIPDEAYSAHLLARGQKEVQEARLERVSAAYASKSEKSLEKALVPLPVPEFPLLARLPITYKAFSPPKGYPLLLDTFDQSRQWFASKEGLDALLLLKQTKIASRDRIRLYWYDLFSDTTSLIFDQVVIDQGEQRLQEAIGSALLARSAGSGYGLLIFDNYTSSLTIEANGLPLSIEEGAILLPVGEYSLLIQGEGFLSKEMSVTVSAKSILHIPTALERKAGEEMQLFSPLGKVSWYVDGLLYGEGSSLSLGSSLIPLVVVAQKEGFASKTLQIQKPFKSIEVMLKPQWMAEPLLLQQRQKDFYTSLRNTMLVFGLYVASSTLSQTYDVANPLWQSLQVATSGFALVSTLHTIMNLAQYASLASSGVQ